MSESNGLMLELDNEEKIPVRILDTIRSENENISQDKQISLIKMGLNLAITQGLAVGTLHQMGSSFKERAIYLGSIFKMYHDNHILSYWLVKSPTDEEKFACAVTVNKSTEIGMFHILFQINSSDVRFSPIVEFTIKNLFKLVPTLQ